MTNNLCASFAGAALFAVGSVFGPAAIAVPFDEAIQMDPLGVAEVITETADVEFNGSQPTF